MSIIRRLDDDCIRRLAAGEVIHRPVNVVKELLENALDAKSKTITVRLVHGGLSSITIQDDGHGISSDQLTNLFSPHCTSKLQEIEDLRSLTTYGFRGEALYSMSSIARVSIISKIEDSPSAYSRHAGSTEAVEESKPFHRGTRVEVCDLFHNMPLRRKIIEKNGIGKEVSLIKDLICKYGCCLAPDTNISLYANSTLVYANSKDKPSLISDIFPGCLPNCVDQIDAPKEQGVESLYSIRSNSAADQTCIVSFVNGRLAEITYLSKALKRHLQDNDKMGLYLELQVSPTMIDFNVSPTKNICSIKNHDEVLNVIIAAIGSAKPHANSAKVVAPSTTMTTPFEKLPDSPFKIRSESNMLIESFTAIAQQPLKSSPQLSPVLNLQFIGMIDDHYSFVQAEEHLHILNIYALTQFMVTEKCFKDSFSCLLPKAILIEQNPELYSVIVGNSDFFAERGVHVVEDIECPQDPLHLQTIDTKSAESALMELMISVVQLESSPFNADFYRHYVFPVVKRQDLFKVMEYATRITDVPFLFKTFERC